MSQLLRTFVKTQIQHDPQTREVKRLESLVEELQFNLKEANDQLHAAHTQIALLQGERRVVLPKVQPLEFEEEQPIQVESLSSFEMESEETHESSVALSDDLEDDVDMKAEVLLKIQPLVLKLKSSEVVVGFREDNKDYKLHVVTPSQSILLRPTLALSQVRTKTLNLNAQMLKKGSTSISRTTAFLSALSLPSRHHVVATFEDGARVCLRPRLFQRELEQVGLTDCSIPVWQHLPTGEILNPTGGCLSVVGTDLVGADCDKSVKWRCVDTSCRPLVPDKVVLRLNESPVTKVELLQTIELPAATTPTRFEQVGLQFSKASDDLVRAAALSKVTNNTLAAVEASFGDVRRNLHAGVMLSLEPEIAMGSGLLARVIYANRPTNSFLMSTLMLDPRTVALPPGGKRGTPFKFTAEGSIKVPESGEYKLVVSRLGSDLKVEVNGEVVLDEWSGSFLGMEKVSKPFVLQTKAPGNIRVSSEGIVGAPSFTMRWIKPGQLIPEPIPSHLLFPTYRGRLEPLCGPNGNLLRLDCRRTFRQVHHMFQESMGILSKGQAFEMQASCPSGCLPKGPSNTKVFGSPGCYALHSSVCQTALHAGVTGLQGGNVLLTVDVAKATASYEPSTGAFDVKSLLSPLDSGCATIVGAQSSGGPFMVGGVGAFADPEDVKPGALSTAFHGDFRKLTVSRSAGPARLQDASLVPSSDSKSSIVIKDGAVLEPVFSADGLPTSPILDLIAFETQSPGPLSLPLAESSLTFWSRQVAKGLQLYTERATLPFVEFEYPSRALSCGSSLESLSLGGNGVLERFVARCPANCRTTGGPTSEDATPADKASPDLGKALANMGARREFTFNKNQLVNATTTRDQLVQVSGGFFSHSSSICLSGVYSGVVPEEGGLVDVQIIPSSLKRNIKLNSRRPDSRFRISPSPLSPRSIDHPLLALKPARGNMCYYPSLTAFKAVLGGEIPDVEVVRKDPKSGDVLGIDNVSKEDANDVSNVQHLSKPQQSAKFKSGVHQVAPHRFLQADFGDMIRMSDLYLDELSSGVEGQTTAMRQARSDIMATAGHFLRLRELYTAALKNQANLINRLQGGVPKARSDTADAPIDLANLKSLHPLLKIMDHPTAEDGPSNWHVDATTPLDLLSSPSASVESVVEHTGAISSSVNVGSVLLLNERHYPQGFATTRLVMPLESLGRVGLVFNRQNEDNFNIVEVEARPGMSPRLQFRQVYQGLMSEPLNRVKLEVDDMDLRRWSGGLPLSLEWGSNGARAAVWREEGVFLGALNPTASAVRTQWIPKHRLTGGQVGMFVDGLVSDGDAVTVAFRSVRWGHSSSLPALASFMVPRAAPAAKGAQRLLQQLADELWKEENAERAEQGIQLEPEEAPEIKPPQIGAVGQAGKAILDSVKRLLVSPTASCQRELFYPKQDGWRLGSDFKASVSGDWSAPGGSIESTLHPKTKQQLDCEKSSSTPEPTSEPRVEVTDPTPLLVTSVSAEASLLVPTALCAGRQSVFWKSRVQAKIKVPAEGRLGFALDIQSDLRVVLLASKTSENDVLVEAVFQNSTGSKDVILPVAVTPQDFFSLTVDIADGFLEVLHDHELLYREKMPDPSDRIKSVSHVALVGINARGGEVRSLYAGLVIAVPLLDKTVRPDLYYETGVVLCAADDGADFSAVSKWLARGSGLEPDPQVQRDIRPVKSCCGAHAFHQFINRSPRWTKDPHLNNSLNFDSDVDLTQGWLPLKMRARLCDAKSFLYPEHVVDGRPVTGSPAVYSRYDYRWYKPFQQKCQGLDVLTYCFKTIYDERTRIGKEFIETAYPYPTSVFAMAAVDKVQRACDEEDGYLRQAYRARVQDFNRTFAENFDYRYGTYLFRLGVQQPWTRVDRRFLIDTHVQQDWLSHRDRITVEHFHQVAFVAKQVYDWYWSNVMWTARVSLGVAALVYVPLALCVPRYMRLGFCTSLCSVVSCCWLYSLIAGCHRQKRKRIEVAESREREQQIVQELDEVLESL